MAVESGDILLVISIIVVVSAITWLLTGRMRIALELLLIMALSQILTIWFVASLKPNTSVQFAASTGFPALMILIFGLRYNQLIKDPYLQFRKNLSKQTYEKTFSAIDEEFTKDHPGELSDLITTFNKNTNQIANLLNLLAMNEGAINAESREVNRLTIFSNRGMEDSVNGVDEILQSVVILDEAIQTILQDTREAITEINLKFNEIYATLSNSDRLTDQTNLIAVNAAIEAAHSGESGENFNIVAQSIQQISSRTREATDKLIRETSLTRNFIDSKVSGIQIQIEQLEELILKIAELADNSSVFAHLQQETGKKVANITDSISQKSLQIQEEVNRYAT